jgi:hypothetical protein
MTTPSAARRTLGLLGAFAAAGLGLACATADRPDKGTEWMLADEPTLRIGAQDGDPAYLFDRIAAVRLLPNGDLAVADGGSATVRVYDASGAHMATMGRRGQGPGEFGRIGHLEVRAPDTILAYDAFNYRATRFLLDGTHVDDVPIRTPGGAPEVYIGTYSNGDAAVAALVPSSRGGTDILPDRMAVSRAGRDGTTVAELGMLEGIRRAGGVAVVPFSPFLHARLLRDSVFHTDGREPVVRVLGAHGRTARSLPVPMAAPDHGEAWRTLRAELEAREITSWIEDLPAEVESEPVPAIAAMLLGRGGNLWLKHYDPAVDATHLRDGRPTGGRWTVVAPEGDVVGEITMPESFAPLDVSTERVAGVQVDSLGVERVVVFEIEG